MADEVTARACAPAKHAGGTHTGCVAGAGRLLVHRAVQRRDQRQAYSWCASLWHCGTAPGVHHLLTWMQASAAGCTLPQVNACMCQRAGVAGCVCVCLWCWSMMVPSPRPPPVTCTRGSHTPLAPHLVASVVGVPIPYGSICVWWGGSLMTLELAWLHSVLSTDDVRLPPHQPWGVLQGAPCLE
jgi:hypothetical protein